MILGLALLKVCDHVSLYDTKEVSLESICFLLLFHWWRWNPEIYINCFIRGNFQKLIFREKPIHFSSQFLTDQTSTENLASLLYYSFPFFYFSLQVLEIRIKHRNMMRNVTRSLNSVSYEFVRVRLFLIGISFMNKGFFFLLAEKEILLI